MLVKKSVYSLVLMDDVVEAIDRMAYSMNTSRSNLINQILAEHVAMPTPEKRMHDVFQSLQQLMTDTFQILDQPSEAMMSIRSQLRYKYKPTIRYGLELYRNPENANHCFGRLKVAFRTQNQSLLQALETFFRIWDSLEAHYIGEYFENHEGIKTDGSRYIRELHMPANLEIQSGEALGSALSAYITMLDTMIKFFFANLNLPLTQLTQSLELEYRKYLADPAMVII